MNYKDIEELALLRYKLILPVLNDDFMESSATKYFETIAAEAVLFPDGKRKIVKVGTLRMWLSNYRKFGFEGLKNKKRKDRGRSRSLTPEQKEVITKLKTERPRRTATSIYKQCVEEGIITERQASLSTIQRYIKSIKPHINGLISEDRRAFEMEFSNDLWQIDTSHGPYLTIDKKKVKMYMIMIIDDASRMIVGHGIFDADNSVNVQKVLKHALKTHGIPKRLYTDNGTPYHNQQLEIICASLGIGLRRAQVYRPQSTGKIERNFRSVKESWMYNINYDDFSSPEELNSSLAEYVNEKNELKHAALKTSPWLRFLEDQQLIKRLDNDVIDKAFLHTVNRRVNNDATIKLENLLYEASQEFIGQNVTIKYQPDLSEVFLVDDNNYITLKEVNKVENSKIKRRQPLLSTMEDKTQ